MSDKPCILCSRNTNDVLQLGEKVTCEDTTAHLYCLLLTSNLVQRGEDNEGISGFLPKDIKSEVWRTKKLSCYYCQEKGATIGCCAKSCRRSFHLPCALEHDCRLEFSNTFRSFCDAHHDIKRPKNVHKPTDLCTICYDEMGKYNPIRSIPLPCCNKNAWCHKLCLQQYAQTSGYFLRCPLCKDSDKFRQHISERGVFIPDRDAKWEVDESGPNAFYSFEQHSERPKECEAMSCKCSKGRNYQVDSENHKFSMVYCDYCGSHAIHLGCLSTKDYSCEECTYIMQRSRENSSSSSTTNSTVGSSRSQHRFGPYLTNLIASHNLQELRICLRRLTPEDLDFKLEQVSSESDASSSSSNSLTEGSSSDAIIFKPRNKAKRLTPSSTSESDGDIEIIVKPAKRTRLEPRCQFFDSDDEVPKFDINDNSRNLQSSNLDLKQKTMDRDFLFEQSRKQSPINIHNCLFSSSEEENPIISTSSNVSKSKSLDSSDDQTIDKENEKPSKSVAVVRPFPRSDTSSTDENIKVVNLNEQPRFSSSDEQFNDFQQPNKKRQRTVMSYFRDTSLSDDDSFEPKIRKKSPKSKQRAQSEVPLKQATIIHYFERQLNQSM